MKIKTTELLSRVYALLNENETLLEERVEYGEPEAMLKPLILDLLPDAARTVLLEAPAAAIDDSVSAGSLERIEGMTPVTFRLPADFLRLIYLKMDGWNHGLSVPLQTDGEEYALRMGMDRLRCRRRIGPAAAVRRMGADQWLEIFGAMAGTSVARLIYLPVPAITDGHMDLPPGLVTDVCRKTAEMVFDVIKN